jgi:hypothetical protein
MYPIIEVTDEIYHSNTGTPSSSLAATVDILIYTSMYTSALSPKMCHILRTVLKMKVFSSFLL